MSVARKKSRATTACDYCRIRRAKCDGKSPICSNCLVNDLECTYNHKTKKRGIPTGYINTLETQVSAFQALLGRLTTPDLESGSVVQSVIIDALQQPQNLISNFQASVSAWENSYVSSLFTEFVNSNKEEIKKKQSSLKNASPKKESTESDTTKSTTSVPHATEATQSEMDLDLPLLRPSNDLTGGTPSPVTFKDFAFVDIDYESLLINDIFQLSPEDINPLESNPPVALHYHGLSQRVSGFSEATIYKYTSNSTAVQRNPFRVGTIFNVSSDIMANNLKQAGQVKVPLEIYRFPTNFRMWVENYFQVFHPWIPMLDRTQILRHVARLVEQPNSTPNLEICSIIALIWAIVALERADKEPRLAYSYARNAVLALECAPVTTIETIQGMLLLGLFFYKAGDWDNSWVLVSSASRMAIDVRLMRPTSKSHEKGLKSFANFNNTSRERTWATAYLINTLLAARMGRSPLIRETDWPTPQISDDGWEEWESWKSDGFSGPLKIESGRCLSIFNELLKVVAFLNTALTCNIEAEVVESSRKGDDVKAGKRQMLNYFKNEIAKWRAELPPHCELHSNQSPMVAYLHMCLNLVWCVACVRLLHVKNDDDMNSGTIVEMRNQEYTTACVSIRKIFDLKLSKLILEYPFMDYLVLMALNFPGMLVLNPNSAHNHTARIAELLEEFSKKSTSCRITWDLYRIEGGLPLDKKSACSENLEVKHEPESTQLQPLQSLQSLQSLQPLQPLQHRYKQAGDDDNLLNLLNNSAFPSMPKFDYKSKQRYSNYSQSAPKEELDLFMLDTDFARNDSRLDRFMRNLGFVSNESGSTGQQ